MNKLVSRSLAILIGLLVIAPAGALSLTPTITFDQLFFDFGTIQHGQTVVHTYKVSNTGGATLHIKNVKPGCHCTSMVVGKMSLEPGESTEIRASFTPPTAFSGAARKTIMVVCDDPAHSTLTLRFAANVLPGTSAL
jgi:hypothetical protein